MRVLFVQPSLVLRGKLASEMAFEDFMALEFGRLINEDHDGRRKYADVGIIDGEIDSERVRFFLKRTYHEPFVNAFRQMSALRVPHYNTMREAIAVGQLGKSGILVNDAVAYGERKVLGFPRASFVISREIDGLPLQENFRDLPGVDRIAVMREYGDLLARLHDGGFYQRVKFNDLLYRRTGEGSCELILIDRDVVSPRPKKLARRQQAIRNTATNLRLTLKNFPMTPREGLAFLRAYKEASGLFRNDSKSVWYSLVKRKFTRLVKKKKPIWRKLGIKWRQ